MAFVPLDGMCFQYWSGNRHEHSGRITPFAGTEKQGLIISHREGKEIHYTLADTKTANLLHKAIDDLFEINCPAPKHK